MVHNCIFSTLPKGKCQGGQTSGTQCIRLKWSGGPSWLLSQAPSNTMAPFICAVLDSLGRPMPSIRVSFALESASQCQTFTAFTDDDGHVTSWTSTDPHRVGPQQRHIFYDSKTIKGLLKFFGPEQVPGLPWREIIVHVHLNGGQSHCIMLQLLDPLEHQVRHVAFTPEARPIRKRAETWWSAEEDEKLMELRCQGWRIRHIHETRALQKRSEASLSSRAKLLVQQYKRNLKTRAQREARP